VLWKGWGMLESLTCEQNFRPKKVKRNSMLCSPVVSSLTSAEIEAYGS
jgi:hypothetical protein